MSTGIETAFTGRLGGDAELKHVKNGTLALASFSVAVDIKSGADPQWIRCALFGDKAEDLAPRLLKGERVYCEGTLTLDRWEKNGEPKSGLSVSAWTVQPLGQIGKRKPKKLADQQQPGPVPQSGQPLPFSDEIPFAPER